MDRDQQRGSTGAFFGREEIESISFVRAVGEVVLARQVRQEVCAVLAEDALPLGNHLRCDGISVPGVKLGG